MRDIVIALCVAVSNILFVNTAFAYVDVERENWAERRKEVVLLRADLAKMGVESFMTNAALPKTAPHIHSQCWVDWLPKEEVERRAYEQENRDFGLDLVRQLERVAVEDIQGREADYLERRIVFLLRLHDWLSTEHGYGNYYVSRWALHIALTSMAMLALDDEVSPEEVRALLSRVPDKNASLRFRLNVLNSEAPHRFMIPVLDYVDGNRRLNIQWCKHMKDTDDHYRALYERGQRKRVPYRFSEVKDDDPVYAFYWDDEIDGKTLRESWDKKSHYCLSVGDIDRDCRGDVERILKYREEMGKLPTPDGKECTDDCARRAYIDRIDYGWTMKHLYGESLHVGGVVVQLYSGIPLDLETQRLRQRLAKRDRIME